MSPRRPAKNFLLKDALTFVNLVWIKWNQNVRIKQGRCESPRRQTRDTIDCVEDKSGQFSFKLILCIVSIDMMLQVTQSTCRVFIPVGQEGADDVLRVFGDLHVIGEVQGVFMVHDLAVGSHQRVGVERRVT